MSTEDCLHNVVIARDRDTPVAWPNQAQLIVVVLAAATIALYWQSSAWLLSQWESMSGTFSHGLLVTAISAYLTLQAARAIDVEESRPFWPAIALVAVLSLLWLLGFVANVAAVHSTLLPLICLTSIWAALGPVGMRRTAFPILYLLLAMPIWGHVAFVFQHVTIVIVHILLRLAEIPVYVEGARVYVPSGTFEIEDGCSGLRYVLAGSALAALYGYLAYADLRNRLLLIGAAIAAALLSNWLRVFGIVVIGHSSEMQSRLVDDHLLFGWILFALFMVPVFVIARHLEKNDPGAHQRSSRQETGEPEQAGNPRIRAGVLAALAALAIGPIWANAIRPVEYDETVAELAFPQLAAPWDGPYIMQSAWLPRYAQPTIEGFRTYTADGQSVLVYRNLYLTQKQDSELVYYSNSIIGNWVQEESAIISVVSSRARDEAVRQTIAHDTGSRWLVWSWYDINERRIADDLRAKMYQSIAILKGHHEAGLTAFATRCAPSCDGAAERLAEFLKHWDSGVVLGNSGEHR